MRFSTLKLRNLAVSAALVACFGIGAVTANAAAPTKATAFVYNGLVYKTVAKKYECAVQKPGTKAADGTTVDAYTGDIVIPEYAEYNGEQFKVTNVPTAAFKGNTEITSVVFPATTITKLNDGTFDGCTALKSVTLPTSVSKLAGKFFAKCTALVNVTIPANITDFGADCFNGATSIETMTFEAGDQAIAIPASIFNGGGFDKFTTVTINRPIDGSKYTAMADKPFRGNKVLTTVVLGSQVTALPTSYFENCAGLTNLTLSPALASLGTNVFAGCSSLAEITLPAGITTIPSSTFQGCTNLAKVRMEGAVTKIEAMAFLNAHVSDIVLPETIESIGQMAFSGSALKDEVVLPAALKTIGEQAFANNKDMQIVKIPAATQSIGDGAFMGCTSVTRFVVDAANTAYTSGTESFMISTFDGKTLVVLAPASPVTSIGGFTSLRPYAAYMCANLTAISSTIAKCTDFGDYSLYGTNIEEMQISGTIGRYVLANNTSLKSLEIAGNEVPYGIAKGCTALQNVSFTDKITVVKQDAFAGCTALKEINLGTILAILEADCFNGSGIEKIIVAAANPAAMADGVFKEGDAITVMVPNELVDTYKNAGGWKYLAIVGDENLAVGPKDMGMPSGIYYAGADGNLYAAYDESDDIDTYDVGGIPHTFQLAVFKNRIYGACAGKKFVYSATGSVDGDGKLFYISKVAGQLFQAVVLDNTGNNAYKDPFGLYVYGEYLFVNDRNVCVRKIPADAIALPQNYESWMENNWMGFYNAPWTYGCIKSGWGITTNKYVVKDGKLVVDESANKEPRYWLGMKYNGNGIYTFQDENIGTSSVPGVKPEGSTLLNSITPIFTTFYVDEAHDQIYIYIETAGSEDKLVKGGVYRIDMDKLLANGETNNFADLGAILVDGSPVKYEGSGTNEHVGISQFSAEDGYLYWCYRAPTAAEAATNEAQDYTTQCGGKYWWADKYDESNPLHHSGIKRVKLGEAEPKVEMVIPGVEGYGCVPVNFIGSKRDAVNDITVDTKEVAATITVAGGILTVSADAVVSVYDMSGLMVARVAATAGEGIDVATLPAGAYVASAELANGKVAVAKFVK